MPEAKDREPSSRALKRRVKSLMSAGGANVPSRTPRATMAARASRHGAISSSRNLLTCRLWGARAHNSNYVPWYAMCREILPRLGRRVEYRLARFDPGTGELDLAHLASLIDVRTKLVCCTGASNFLGTRNPLAAVRALGPPRRAAVQAAMNRICAWNRQLTSRALDGLGGIGGITIYGPRDPAQRTSLVAFNLAGRDPVAVAEALDRAGVEARAGCHCATLAHHALGLSPPASCRLSFYLYNTPDDIDQAVAAVAAIAAGRAPAAPWYRLRRRQPGRRPGW